MTKLRLSPSALSAFQSCPLKFAHRYIYRTPKGPPGAALLVGSAVDHALNEDLRGRALGRPGLEPEHAEQLARDSFLERAAKEGLAFDEGSSMAAALGDGRDESGSLARVAVLRVAPHIQVVKPEDVQMRLELEGPDFDVLMFPDHFERGALRLSDLKTSRQRPTAEDGNITSMRLYAWGVGQKLGPELRPTRSVLHWIFKGAKGPEVFRVRSEIPADLQPDVDQLSAVARAAAAGAFPPTDPTSWACSEKWCEFFERCAYGRKRRVQVQIEKA